MGDTPQLIAEAITELDSLDHIKTLVANALSEEIPASDIVERGIREGLRRVGQKYEAGEYFLSELIYVGSLVSDLVEMLRPILKRQRVEQKGVIVLGTVRGDIHDIGKNIFKVIAEGAGFQVHDLGVDVDPNIFVDAVKKYRPQILALSALLTTTLPEMESTLHFLEESGVRRDLRVLLGGNAVSKELSNEIRADAAALDAVEGLEICKEWVRK